MTFLNWPVESLPARTTARRRKLAEGLLDQFSRTFPDIAYEMLWEVPVLNAQAWRLGAKRYVPIYGGLMRHPSLTKAGLALTIAHETGHHLGGPPYDPDLPWLSWQGQADYWAARTAMPLLFGEKARRLTLRGAREIIKLHSDIISVSEEGEPDLSLQHL